jgi:hypothetical protein
MPAKSKRQKPKNVKSKKAKNAKSKDHHGDCVADKKNRQPPGKNTRANGAT